MIKPLFLTLLLTITKAGLVMKEPSYLVNIFNYNNTSGSIQFKLSNFGNLPDEPTKIELQLPPKDNQNGCQEYKDPFYQKEPISFALLVERGDCTFEKKALNAQYTAANFIIVYNNNDDDIEPYTPVDDINTEIVAAIPVLFISRRDGLKIKTAISDGDFVKMEISKYDNHTVSEEPYDPPVPSNETKQINLELWLDPLNKTAYNFLLMINQMVGNLHPQIFFEPIFKFKEDFMFERNDRSSFKKTQCFGNGVYCLGYESPVKAPIIITEAVNQKCIYKIAKEKFSNYIWWRYFTLYRHCITDIDSDYSYEQCIKQNFINARITGELKEEIDQCVRNSFEDMKNATYKDNFILREDYERRKEHNGKENPLLFINGEIMHENFSFENVGKKICDEVGEDYVSACLDIYSSTMSSFPDDVYNNDQFDEYGNFTDTYDDTIIEEPPMIDEPEEPEIISCDGPDDENNNNVFKREYGKVSHVVAYALFGFVSSLVYVITRLI